MRYSADRWQAALTHRRHRFALATWRPMAALVAPRDRSRTCRCARSPARARLALNRHLASAVPPSAVWRAPYPERHMATQCQRSPVTSNVGQNYPYTSETEAERAAAIARLVSEREGLADTLAAEIDAARCARAVVGLEVPDAGLSGSAARGRLFRGEARGLRRLRRDLREDLPALATNRRPRPPAQSRLR